MRGGGSVCGGGESAWLGLGWRAGLHLATKALLLALLLPDSWGGGKGSGTHTKIFLSCLGDKARRRCL